MEQKDDREFIFVPSDGLDRDLLTSPEVIFLLDKFYKNGEDADTTVADMRLGMTFSVVHNGVQGCLRLRTPEDDKVAPVEDTVEYSDTNYYDGWHDCRDRMVKILRNMQKSRQKEGEDVVQVMIPVSILADRVEKMHPVQPALDLGEKADGS